MGVRFACLAGDSGRNESGAAGIDSLPAYCPCFALESLPDAGGAVRGSRFPNYFYSPRLAA
jgi:hypothetical protein